MVLFLLSTGYSDYTSEAAYMAVASAGCTAAPVACMAAASAGCIAAPCCMYGCCIC